MYLKNEGFIIHLYIADNYVKIIMPISTQACLDMMSMMMEFLWSVSSNAITHVQFSRFLNFVIKLVSQLTGETDSNEEKRILYSVLGCLVNLSSSKEILVGFNGVGHVMGAIP